jgi:hypothetical protein
MRYAAHLSFETPRPYKGQFDLSIVKLLERPCLGGGNCQGTLEQIFEIVIVILIESANRCLLPGPLQLSVNVLVLCAVVGFDRQPAVSPQLSLGAKAIRGLEQCDQQGRPDGANRRNLT